MANFQVKYMIVGGYAVMHYSEPRYTKDLDIWIEASSENSEKLYAALREFGAPISTLTAKDFAEPGFFYQMGRPPVRIDVLMSIKGVNFEDAWGRKITSNFGDTEANFIALQDLITAKREAGRAQDLADLESLEKLVK